MKIIIETVPHEEQRYETVGDWQNVNKEELHITVSKTHNWHYDALVAVHELLEALVCRDRGISQETVDAYDLLYLKNPPRGAPKEAGDSFTAPYRAEHFFATTVERMLAAELKVDWEAYEAELDKL